MIRKSWHTTKYNLNLRHCKRVSCHHTIITESLTRIVHNIKLEHIVDQFAVINRTTNNENSMSNTDRLSGSTATQCPTDPNATAA
jgi:hypothetical protein